MKTISALICAVAISAAAIGVAAAADYPPCTSRTQDKCRQMPRSMMHETKMKKSGMKKEGSMQKMEKKMMPASNSGIPHGCSPATTPCQ